MKRTKTEIIWSTEGGQITTFYQDTYDSSIRRDLNARLRMYENAIHVHRAEARSQSRFGEPSPMFVAHYVDNGNGDLGDDLYKWELTAVPYAFMKLLTEKLG